MLFICMYCYQIEKINYLFGVSPPNLDENQPLTVPTNSTTSHSG